MQRSRGLIVSADDFGLSLAVNEAIERAHREGILTTTSLMVAADATHDAIERARRTPTLNVGLHVVVVNGKPALPPELVPNLVDAHGAFPSDLVAAGVRYFFDPRARRQLEAEIRAQFDAFRATGLRLDHVNAQNHMHVHPTILALILKVGREYGVPAVRIPYEPFFPSWRSQRDKLGARLANAVLLLPWLSLMRVRLRAANVASNDYVFGMNDSGEMTNARVLRFLDHLPRGVCEMYFHPATHTWDGVDPAVRHYDFAGEFAALIDPAVIAAARTLHADPAPEASIVRAG